MFPSNFGAISTEKIVRSDLLKPVSFGILQKKSEIKIDEAAEIASVIEENMKLLDTIKIPDHFDRETLRKFFELKIKKNLEEDPLHKQSVRLGKYAEDFRHYMRRYFDEIFDFHEKLKKDRFDYVFAASNLYLRSDFPPSFERTLTLSLLSECRFIDIYDTRLRHEYLGFVTAYNDHKKFERLCDAHNQWGDPIESMIDNIDKTRVGLVWYVEFTQSEKLEDIFKPKTLRGSLLDQEYFFGVLVDLQKQTEQFRRELVRLGKEAFIISPSREDPTVDMFCGIMDAMGY